MSRTRLIGVGLVFSKFKYKQLSHPPNWKQSIASTSLVIRYEGTSNSDEARWRELVALTIPDLHCQSVSLVDLSDLEDDAVDVLGTSTARKRRPGSNASISEVDSVEVDDAPQDEDDIVGGANPSLAVFFF